MQEVITFNPPVFADVRQVICCASHFHEQLGEAFGYVKVPGGWNLVVMPGPDLVLELVRSAVEDWVNGLNSALRMVNEDEALARAREWN